MALQPEVDAYESTVESAQADEPSGEVGMPPAVKAFMRHLIEYVHSQNHQTTVQFSSAEDANQRELNVSAEAQKDTDRVQFAGEPYPRASRVDAQRIRD